MSNINTVLVKTKTLTLTRHENRKSGRRFYTITLSRSNRNIIYYGNSHYNKINSFMNQCSHREFTVGNWKFRTRKEAANMLTLASLQWNSYE